MVEKKTDQEFNEFFSIVKRLRQECPWDRKQTLKSMSEYLIEEGFELIAAIKKSNLPATNEELGDVLLVVVMMMVLLEEKGISGSDVIKHIKKKIIARHPHVFGKDTAKTAEEVLEKWDKRKGREWNIEKDIPALIRAYKIQERAKRKGFEWNNISGVYDKIEEEIEELKNAKNPLEIEEEFGDILFVVAHLGNFLNFSPEIALHKACDKFSKRFERLEKEIEKYGKKNLSLQEMDSIWQKIKKEI